VDSPAALAAYQQRKRADRGQGSTNDG
jgi:hypothetical protein